MRIKGKDYGGRSYEAIHDWLRNNFGKATFCSNVYCLHKSKKFDYALLIGKKYERNRWNFWTLCRSCHLKYDKHRIGWEPSYKTKKQISNKLKKYFKENGISKETIEKMKLAQQLRRKKEKIW